MIRLDIKSNRTLNTAFNFLQHVERYHSLSVYLEMNRMAKNLSPSRGWKNGGAEKDFQVIGKQRDEQVSWTCSAGLNRSEERWMMSADEDSVRDSRSLIMSLPN